MNKWDIRWFRLAREFSSWSKDPSTQCGAVAVDQDNDCLSWGWNGFPRGYADNKERLGDRGFKLEHVVHAEANCIYNASRIGRSLKGSTLYLYTVSAKELHVSGIPICMSCSLAVAQAGIKVVKICHPGKIREEWIESTMKAREFLQEVDVDYVMGYDPRELG